VRILLTGATGFVGSHVARVLVDEGDEIIALIRPGSGTWRLTAILDRLRVVTGDIEDRPSLQRAIREHRPDTCIHLAWYAEPGEYLNSERNIASLQASLGLFADLIQGGCNQIVTTGTCAEYDTDLGFLREDGPTRPATLYAASKLSLALIGQRMASLAGVNFAWARLFYVYGPREDPRRIIPSLIRSLLAREAVAVTPADQVRDYLHVADVATALCQLAARRADGIFNVASGVPVTMKHVMQMAGELLKRPNLIQFGAVPYRAWEPMFIVGDNQRLRAKGWAARYTLDSGLRDTIFWWTHPDRQDLTA
jgi:nucleoside-diphosphate-sugar epimerase